MFSLHGFSLFTLLVMNFDRYLATSYPIFHRTSVTKGRLLTLLAILIIVEITSGVTTMGSDRANPGAPNPNGPNGGPQAVEQKLWPGPLICHNVVFRPSQFCKISGWACPGPLENSCIYGAQLVPLAFLLGRGLRKFWGPWYNVTPLEII
jgi:hypothetical protein